MSTTLLNEQVDGAPRQDERAPAQNGNGHYTTVSSFEEVTAERPCAICGKPDYCSRSSVSAFCRRQSSHPTYGTGEQRTDKAGGTFYAFRTALESGNKLPTPKYSIADGGGKLAEPEVLDRVHRRVLAKLPAVSNVHPEMKRRNLPDEAVFGLGDMGLRKLPDTGRAKWVAELIEEGLEQHFSQVPGFVIRGPERGREPYWTFAGRSGIVIPLYDADGRVISLQVRPDDAVPGKKYLAITSKTKKDGGVGPGSHVTIPPHQGDKSTVRLTEGHLKCMIATILSKILTIGLPGVGVWKRAAKILKQIGAKRILVAFDMDWKTNAAVAGPLYALLIQLREKGFDVAVETWDCVKGIDDALLAGDEIARIQTHEGEALEQLLVEIKTAAEANGGRAPSVDSEDDRRVIEISTNEFEVANQIEVVLAERDGGIYQRGNRLVNIIAEAKPSDGSMRRAAGTKTIRMTPFANLRERISQHAKFIQTREVNGDLVEQIVSPPNKPLEGLFARGYWGKFPPLAGLTEYPLLRPDGTVLSTPGYDRTTGIYCGFDEELKIVEKPSRDDATKCAGDLVDLTCDFPFDKPAYRSAWLAYLLTPLARYAFEGSVPMFVSDANLPGSGKTKLMELPCLIATGRGLPVMDYTSDDDEMRKRITSMLMAGDAFVLFDNITGDFGCSAIDALITGSQWKDRILGGNQMAILDAKTILAATGNNLGYRGDLYRRVVPIRLNSKVESPELRTGFKYQNLTQYVLDNRMDLLSKALTILVAFCRAGRPQADVPAFGSFEEWSSLVRQAVIWCGLPDPLKDRREVAMEADRSIGASKAVILNWDLLSNTKDGLTTTEVLEQVKQDTASAAAHCHPSKLGALQEALLAFCPGKNGELPQSVSLGRKFIKLNGRVCGDKQFRSNGEKNGSKLWGVWPTEDDSQGVAGDSGDAQERPREKSEPPNKGIDIQYGPEGNNPLNPSIPRSNPPNDPARINHKIPGSCSGKDAWQHRNGNWYCKKCWPCQDEQYRAE